MKILSATLFLGLAVGSCNAPEEKGVPKERNAQPAAIAPERKNDTVRIIAMKFVPSEITVKPGTTIVFVNDDMVTHDVTEEAKSWSSNLLPPSKSWQMTADKSVHYYCSIHVVMKGSIVVSQ